MFGCAPAGRSDPEIAAPGVLRATARVRRRLDEAAVLEATQHVVEGASGGIHAAAGPELDVFANRVAVGGAIGEGEEDLKLERAEIGHEGSWLNPYYMNDYTSIERGIVARGVRERG
jgi:hypothetical protein